MKRSPWQVDLNLGVGLAILGGGMWGIIAPWVTDVPIWCPTGLGIIGLLIGIGVTWEGVSPAQSDDLTGTTAKKRRQLARSKDYAPLQNLGINVRALRRDRLLVDPTWVEKGDIAVAGSPIRWIQYTLAKRFTYSHGRFFYAPDVRFPSRVRKRRRIWIYSTRVRRFPVFGPVRQVR